MSEILTQRPGSENMRPQRITVTGLNAAGEMGSTSRTVYRTDRETVIGIISEGFKAKTGKPLVAQRVRKPKSEPKADKKSKK